MTYLIFWWYIWISTCNFIYGLFLELFEGEFAYKFLHPSFVKLFCRSLLLDGWYLTIETIVKFKLILVKYKIPPEQTANIKTKSLIEGKRRYCFESVILLSFDYWFHFDLTIGFTTIWLLALLRFDYWFHFDLTIDFTLIWLLISLWFDYWFDYD